MKSLRFKKLWLVSEAARSARQIQFDPKRTLLLGKNHTGKSTVIKHIFRTLGCETKGKSDRWDKHALSVLEFEINEEPYTAYRRANVFALRDDSSDEIIVTTKYPEWVDLISRLFDFRLMLPTHQDKLAQATPPYLFLPYYMDQDASWLQQWHSFDKLTQFTNWKKPLAAYVTGQRPNGYYIAKFDESQVRASVNQINNELGVVNSALARVKKSLPNQSVNLDPQAFKQEVTDLLRVSTQLKNEQEQLRRRAFECAAQKESIYGQISLAKDALRELEGDLKYLTDSKPEATVVCPTCGTNHDNGFPVRLELIDDALTLRSVISELEIEQIRVEGNLSEIQQKMSRVKHKSLDIEKTLQKKKGALKLQDIVDSKSADVVRTAFNSDIVSLKRKLSEQQELADKLKFKVAQFDLPDRVKAINEFYAEKIQLFALELGVQDLREDIKARPDATITVSGSALPRSLLAYQFAILYTAFEMGDTKNFPIVIDSPNQQGQDSTNLMRMLNFIVKRTPTERQLILGVEDMPQDMVFDGSIIELTKPFELLDTEQYELARNQLAGLVEAVEKGIDKTLMPG